MPHEARDASIIAAIEEKIRGVIARYSMLPAGAAVIVGFSGGADSAALTHFLSVHREEYGISLKAAHLNHGLRETAGRDEEAARIFCEERGIPFFSRRADVGALAREQGLCVEDCGRRLRYAFFRELTGDAPNARIATAHTASDHAETMVMNLTRGAGARGLSGIPPVNGSVIRPLIALTREDVERYCAWYDLPYVQDESNFEEIYARNRVRRRVIPVLRTLNPSLENSMLRAAELLREDDALLCDLARNAMEQSRHGGGWKLSSLRALPRPILSRALILMAKEAGAGRLTHEQVEDMERAVQNGGAATVAGGIQILAKGNTLFAQSPSPCQSGWSVPLRPEGTVLPDGRTLRIRIFHGREAENQQKFYKFLFHNPGNYDTIQNDMVVRTRLPGDRFRPAGRGVTKPLRRLLAENGVPPAARDHRILLAESGGEIRWAEGLGPCEAWDARGCTAGVFLVEIEK